MAVDVHYSDQEATAAAVAFVDEAAAAPSSTWVESFVGPPAAYEPGQFYKRELPFLLSLVERARSAVEVELVVVDGHVWLGAGQPGLGRHLFDSIGGAAPVVGIAKSPYREGVAVPVFRGGSRRPLFVTSVGVEEADAVRLVEALHGDGRLPTMVRAVDRLARRGKPTFGTVPEVGPEPG